MKNHKLFFVCCLLSILPNVYAQDTDCDIINLARDQFIPATKYQEGSMNFYFKFNACDDFAMIIDCRSQKNGYQYKKETLVIPKTMRWSSGTGSTGSSMAIQEYLIPVVEIGEGAFVNATSSAIQFSTPSNLRVIRQRAMSSMPNMTGALELPEGLKLIETEGIYTGFTSLVIPASIDSLCLSAILLEKVESIVFLGSTPPRCAVEGSITPWNNAEAATPKDIDVQVPEGSFDAYKNKDGIGDYFTCFGRSSVTTDIQQAEAVGKKGIYSLTGSYLGEDESVLPRGMYIIDGKKVIR